MPEAHAAAHAAAAAAERVSQLLTPACTTHYPRYMSGENRAMSGGYGMAKADVCVGHASLRCHAARCAAPLLRANARGWWEVKAGKPELECENTSSGLQPLCSA